MLNSITSKKSIDYFENFNFTNNELQVKVKKYQKKEGLINDCCL